MKGDHGKKRTMWIILSALDDREKAEGDFVKKNRESFLNGLKRKINKSGKFGSQAIVGVLV